LAAKDPNGLAEALAKLISDIESEFQNNLEVSYEKMNNTSFKALRRQLPMTAKKIQWEKIAQYTIGGDLKKN